MIIIHGPDQLAAQNKLDQFLNSAKDKSLEITKIEAKDLTPVAEEISKILGKIGYKAAILQKFWHHIYLHLCSAIFLQEALKIVLEFLILELQCRGH